MGVAKGYSWDILEPFVISFARNCRSAELILFVDDISDFTRDQLIKCGVVLGTYPKELYNWFVDCFGRSEADKLAEKKIICCGTIIGTINEVKIFCRIMWDALKDKTIWGHEQATSILFADKVGDAARLSNRP